ncbi:MAG: sulfite exporter TauE/SafE family protein [Gammaproteobacteria bacterium]|nr:sulfite exporter TauE/SafE family protein [Gammaproteobacteria bacterium]
MLGQGGGALYTPLQVLAGVGFHEAATTSLFLIVVVSLSSTLVFRRGRKVDFPLVAVLAGSMACGALGGALVSASVSAAALTLGFAVFVAIVALLMVAPGRRAAPVRLVRRGRFYWERRLEHENFSINLALAVPSALASGIASGMLGIGGGVVMVPIMVLLLGVPIDVAVGSSATMVGISAALGFAGHLVHGHWDWQTSLLLSVAVFAGAQIGARISLTLDKAVLQRIFGCFLLVVAALMAFEALAPTPRSGDVAARGRRAGVVSVASRQAGRVPLTE